MMLRAALRAFACFLLCGCTSAFAYFGPLTLDPPVLLEGRTGVALITYGLCDGLTDTGPLDRQVVVSNGVVTITVNGIEASSPFCLINPSTAEFIFGPLPKGDYVVTLVRHNTNVAITDVIGTANLTVVGDEPVPATGTSALLVLVLGFLVTGLLFHRRSPRGSSSIVLAMFLVPCCAHAAQWSIGSATAAPGGSATIAVTIAGDGQTTAAELTIVFDDERITVPNGALPSQNGGSCSRVSSNTIKVLGPSTGTVLPTGPLTYCSLPVTVWNPAPSGMASLTGIGQLCFTSSGSTMPCGVTSGTVTVTSGGQSFAATRPTASEQYLFVELTQSAPSVESITSFDFSSTSQAPPLAGLDVEYPKRAEPVLHTFSWRHCECLYRFVDVI